MDTTLHSEQNKSEPLLLIPGSQVSVQGACNNCHIMLDQVTWQQCKICNLFDLCDACTKPDVDLQPDTIRAHEQHHVDQKYPTVNMKADMGLVKIGEVETVEHEILDKIIEDKFQEVMDNKKIENDYEMSIVMDMLYRRMQQGNAQPSTLKEKEEEERSKVGSMLLEYHMQAYKTTIRVLSLDGGGVRGYMSIKVLWQLIKDTYLPDVEPSDPPTEDFKKLFKQGQLEFTDQFDYFAGTSTGGLIALCLATKYPLLEIKEIYENPSKYFKKYWLNWMPSLIGFVGDVISAQYNPYNIHDRINTVIDKIFEEKSDDGKSLNAKNATLRDLHNLLNPDHIIDGDTLKLNRQYYGNLLEFVDDQPSTTNGKTAQQGGKGHHVKREKVLLINAYNTTTSCITVFNTSNAEHWDYLIADVLKATMAAPTYFQPWTMGKGTKKNGIFSVEKKDLNVFIDGGVFANDPELTALWAIQKQWKKLVNYRLLSIGTGCYNPQLSPSSWGGLYTWMVGKPKKGLVVDTLMDATRSLTEIITNDLAKSNHIKRMKFNYKLPQSLPLDDLNFPNNFKVKWETLRKEPDYKALVYFYDTYIRKR